METAGIRGESRRRSRKERGKRTRRTSHFQTVRSGGFEESQMICYLWEIVKSLEMVQNVQGTNGELQDVEEGLQKLMRRLRSQIQVEIRRYFARRRHRNVKMVTGALAVVLSITAVFGLLIGVARVDGDSMYPYLNDGDWVVYSRIGSELQRNEVVVFEKDGENVVKRIAGLPGDTVEISPSGNRVVVNGVQVRETYMTLTGTPAAGILSEDQYEREDVQTGAPLTVLDGQYLVLGDNRSVSIDSRDSHMGTVPEETVKGRLLLIVRKGGNRWGQVQGRSRLNLDGES